MLADTLRGRDVSDLRVCLDIGGWYEFLWLQGGVVIVNGGSMLLKVYCETEEVMDVMYSRLDVLLYTITYP